VKGLRSWEYVLERGHETLVSSFYSFHGPDQEVNDFLLHCIRRSLPCHDVLPHHRPKAVRPIDQGLESSKLQNKPISA
jgi:hypothetical protein